ncbi:MAG: hypothetical protein ABJM58_01925 [Alteripontixanthobacter sp.]
MKIGTIAAAAAALTLTASPVLAQSNVDRMPAPVEAPAELGGETDGSAIILALLAAAAIIAGIIIAADGDDDDALSR